MHGVCGGNGGGGHGGGGGSGKPSHGMACTPTPEQVSARIGFHNTQIDASASATMEGEVVHAVAMPLDCDATGMANQLVCGSAIRASRGSHHTMLRRFARLQRDGRAGSRAHSGKSNQKAGWDDRHNSYRHRARLYL